MGGPGKDTPACVGIVTAEVPPAQAWQPRNIASSSSPQIEAESRLFLPGSTGGPGGYFWFPEKGCCCLFIYCLYFWMGVGKRLFLVRWWAVFCSELKH